MGSLRKDNMNVPSEADPFSMIYAITRWTDAKLHYRKDKSFYLVSVEEWEGEESTLRPLFWIDITVFKKLWDMELVDEEYVDAAGSQTAPF